MSFGLDAYVNNARPRWGLGGIVTRRQTTDDDDSQVSVPDGDWGTLNATQSGARRNAAFCSAVAGL